MKFLQDDRESQDIYDFYLTQAEIQGNINHVNGKRGWQGKLSCSLSKSFPMEFENGFPPSPCGLTLGPRSEAFWPSLFQEVVPIAEASVCKEIHREDKHQVMRLHRHPGWGAAGLGKPPFQRRSVE